MTSSFLRKFRVVFSVIVLTCFLVVFWDFRSLVPEKFINYLLFLQFIPSLIKYIDIKTMAAGGFMIILLLTLLSGRTFCSFLCPLGVGQDLNSRIGGKIRKRFRRYGYKKPHTIIRYTILVLTFVLAIFSGVYILILLDPYSIFGRFMTFLGKPVVLAINNLLANILGKFDVYTFSHVEIKGFKLTTYIVPAFFALVVGVFSLVSGRLYCNMICPVGTLLGLVSKISLFRVHFNESKCTKCGRCAVICKSSCIDFLNYEIDVSRCVDCFNCIDTCPEDALSYSLLSPSKARSGDEKPDLDKREFIKGALLLAAGIPSLAHAQQEKPMPVLKKASTVKENKTSPVCPPGAGNLETFKRDCTACSLCITVCPSEVLQPSAGQYGFTGFMQPVMDYSRSFCIYNCASCTEVCPTGALKPLALEVKKLTQIGKVNFIKDNCIVKTDKTACGACSEGCPTKAVFMIPYEGNLNIPDINQDLCIGCGQCEFSCPVTPFKAIYVDGNPIQIAAKKPEIKESGITAPVDFPF